MRKTLQGNWASTPTQSWIWLGIWQEHIIPSITIYHSTQNWMKISNFYSKFWFRPRILKYRWFSNFAWADSKNFCLIKSKILFRVEIYAYFACFILVKIVFEIGFGISNADLATLNFRIYQIEAHIRIQETKLHQNPTLVEKIFFWSKMAFTLFITSPNKKIFKRQIFSCGSILFLGSFVFDWYTVPQGDSFSTWKLNK